MRLVFVFVLVFLGFVLLVVAVVAGALAFPITAAAVGVIAAIGVVVLGVALFIDFFAPAVGTCRLVTRVVFRDTCEGRCPAGQVCTATATRPYGRFITIGVQAVTCACAAPPGGPGGGAPGGGTPGGGQENENG